MKKLFTVVIFSLSLPVLGSENQCTDSFTTYAQETLKKDKFEIQSADKRNRVAVQLLSCIGHPDPDIRDGVVYEAIAHWLRNELIESDTVKVLFNSLTNSLKQANSDPNNFTQPFAALVFSEVIRVDRITPYLTNDERQLAVDISSRYMSNINDFRGFDDNEGWRHSVAHTADVFLQLALNKNTSKPQLEQLLDAIKGQVSPQHLHFYAYGEPKRLAMAFAYIVMREELTAQEISNFIESVTNPSPFASWNKVYGSRKGLAKLHNTRSFIYSIYAITGQSQNPKLKAIQTSLIKAIQQLG